MEYAGYAAAAPVVAAAHVAPVAAPVAAYDFMSSVGAILVLFILLVIVSRMWGI